MAPRAVGAAFGLLAFSTTILAGLWVRNPVAITLGRAIWAMVVFCVIGLVIGAAAQTVVREHTKRREQIVIPPDQAQATEHTEAEGQKTSTAGDAEPMGT